MTYDQLLSQYLQSGKRVDTPAEQQAFNTWTQGIASSTGANSWETIPNDAFTNPKYTATATSSDPYANYVNSNPDLISYYNNTVKSTGMSLADFGKSHWTSHGQYETRPGSPVAATTVSGTPVATNPTPAPVATNPTPAPVTTAARSTPTRLEQTWINQNKAVAQSTFGTLTPTAGQVSNFVRQWNAANGNAPDAMDSAIINEATNVAAYGVKNVNPATGGLYTDAELSDQYARDFGGIRPTADILANYKKDIGVTQTGTSTGATAAGVPTTGVSTATPTFAGGGGTTGGIGNPAGGGGNIFNNSGQYADGGSMGDVYAGGTYGGGGGTTGLPTVGTNTDTDASGRNINAETLATLQAQINLAGPQYDAYRALAPKYAATDLSILGQSLFGPGYQGNSYSQINDALTRQAAAQTQYGNTALRAGDIADVNNLSGQVSAIQRAANPELYASRNQVANLTNQGVPQTQEFRDMQNMAYQGFQQGNPSNIREVGQNFYSPMVSSPTQFERVGSGQIQSPMGAQDVNPFMVSPDTGYNQVQANQAMGPSMVREVGYNQINPNTGYNQVQANTAFDRAQVDQNDVGLASATQRLAESGGPSELQRTLEQQAMQGLAMGRNLSPEDIRNSQQSAREAFAARGLINTNAAVAAEVLNREALGRQREQERQAYAGQVEQAGYAQRQQGFQNAIGLSDAYRGYGSLGLQAAIQNANNQMQGNQFGLNASLANQSAQQQANQLGYQGMVANQQAEMDAARLNQARDLSMSQQGMTMSQANQDANLRAALANQAARQQSNQLGFQGMTANQGAYMDAARLNQARDLSQNQQYLTTGQYNQDSALRAALANQSTGVQMSQLGQQAGLANQQSVLDTNRLNAGQQGVNQQADLNRSQQNLQYLNRADANQMNMFNQLGTLNQNETARRAQELAQYQQQFQNQISTQIDPFQGVLGRASTNVGNNQNLFGQSAGTTASAGATRTQFDPFSAYGADLANTNYNAQEASKIASANNAAALQSANIQASASKSAGISGLLGSLGGAALGSAALM